MDYSKLDKRFADSQARVAIDQQRFKAAGQRKSLDMDQILGKKSLSNRAKFGAFAGTAVIDTILNIHDGDDFGTAAVKGAFDGMLLVTAPYVMGAIELGQIGSAAYAGYHQYQRQQQSWWNKQFAPNFGGNYQDTRRAQTMRQAAVEAIQGSKLNARSALGGEAKIFAQNFNRG